MEELWRKMAALGHEARKTLCGWLSRPARLPHRSSSEESAPGRCKRYGCWPDVAVHDAVSANGRRPHHSHWNLGRGGWRGPGGGRVGGMRLVGTDGKRGGKELVAAAELIRHGRGVLVMGCETRQNTCNPGNCGLGRGILISLLEAILRAPGVRSLCRPVS